MEPASHTHTQMDNVHSSTSFPHRNPSRATLVPPSPSLSLHHDPLKPNDPFPTQTLSDRSPKSPCVLSVPYHSHNLHPPTTLPLSCLGRPHGTQPLHSSLASVFHLTHTFTFFRLQYLREVQCLSLGNLRKGTPNDLLS
jgi:hypothetical protein